MVESGQASRQSTEAPLAGLRVLDISSFIAAPAAAVVLGDWGADVIKIEGPDGDPNRRIMHDSSNYPKAEVNYPWQMDSRNKRSIVLDLKQPPARDALDRLIEKADILICNFPPPVRDKLKLAYDDVKKVNPKLIYASLTGYGESGPDRDRPGFDATAYFARSGLLDAQRYEGGPPGVPGPAQGDRATAMALVSSILMALIHRMKTGESTKVDIAMFDCQLALMENAIMRYTVEGEVPGPLGARHPTITPFQAFATSDGSIIIAAGNDSLFIKMCDALGRPDWASDPNHKTNALRLKHCKHLWQEIESVLKQNTTAHWLAVLGKAGIPCGPINNVAQAISHPQVAARNMLVSVPDGSGGTLKLAGNPLKMSAFEDPTTRRAAPDLDADRAAILSYVGG